MSLIHFHLFLSHTPSPPPLTLSLFLSPPLSLSLLRQTYNALQGDGNPFSISLRYHKQAVVRQ